MKFIRPEGPACNLLLVGVQNVVRCLCPISEGFASVKQAL